MKTRCYNDISFRHTLESRETLYEPITTRSAIQNVNVSKKVELGKVSHVPIYQEKRHNVTDTE